MFKIFRLDLDRFSLEGGYTKVLFYSLSFVGKKEDLV